MIAKDLSGVITQLESNIMRDAYISELKLGLVVRQ